MKSHRSFVQRLPRKTVPKRRSHSMPLSKRFLLQISRRMRTVMGFLMLPNERRGPTRSPPIVTTMGSVMGKSFSSEKPIHCKRIRRCRIQAVRLCPPRFLGCDILPTFVCLTLPPTCPLNPCRKRPCRLRFHLLLPPRSHRPCHRLLRCVQLRLCRLSRQVRLGQAFLRLPCRKIFLPKSNQPPPSRPPRSSRRPVLSLNRLQLSLRLVVMGNR